MLAIISFKRSVGSPLEWETLSWRMPPVFRLPFWWFSPKLKADLSSWSLYCSHNFSVINVESSCVFFVNEVLYDENLPENRSLNIPLVSSFARQNRQPTLLKFKRSPPAWRYVIGASHVENGVSAKNVEKSPRMYVWTENRFVRMFQLCLL